MPFAAALSTKADTPQAVEEVCTQVRGKLDGPADLAFLFFSPHHREATHTLPTAVHSRLEVRCLLGCTGESIVGTGQEVERRPAISLWAARWAAPARLDPFHLELQQTADGVSLLGWPDGLADADPEHAVLLVLGDPFTFPADEFLQQVNENHPGLRVLGGMASGGRAPGQCRLLLGKRVLNEGALGVVVQGPVKIRSVVSQGCRPIGRHMVVTRGQENLIIELGGKPPVVQLEQLWHQLSPHDQDLFQQGLHVGRVINEYQGEFGRGDFLIRNVLGLDQRTGALAITDRVRVGQTVQFHVRDAESADEDLHSLLQMDLNAHESRPAGALLFTCNGRGTHLFGTPHHDARAIQAEAGDLPLAGFFAQGELGPVGGKNFIHGFTASVVLFED